MGWIFQKWNLEGLLKAKAQKGIYFERYKFDINPSIIQAKGNLLEIAFRSPIEYANEKYEEQSQDYIVPPPCTFAQGDCHANHIRKMQSSFR